MQSQPKLLAFWGNPRHQVQFTTAQVALLTRPSVYLNIAVGCGLVGLYLALLVLQLSFPLELGLPVIC
jgi:hypothetical protein